MMGGATVVDAIVVSTPLQLCVLSARVKKVVVVAVDAIEFCFVPCKGSLCVLICKDMMSVLTALVLLFSIGYYRICSPPCEGSPRRRSKRPAAYKHGGSDNKEEKRGGDGSSLKIQTNPVNSRILSSEA